MCVQPKRVSEAQGSIIFVRVKVPHHRNVTRIISKLQSSWIAGLFLNLGSVLCLCRVISLLVQYSIVQYRIAIVYQNHGQRCALLCMHIVGRCFVGDWNTRLLINLQISLGMNSEQLVWYQQYFSQVRINIYLLYMYTKVYMVLYWQPSNKLVERVKRFGAQEKDAPTPEAVNRLYRR